MNPLDCALLQQPASRISGHEWYEKAKGHLSKHKTVEALWCLEKAHAENPDNLEYLIELHNLSHNLSHKKDSYRQKIDQFQCKTVKEYLLKADFYLESDDKKAAELYKEVFLLAPDDFEVQFHYNIALFIENKMKESLEGLQSLLSKKESWPQELQAENEQKVLSVIGTIYYDLDDFQKAEAAFTPLVQSGVPSAEIFLYYALILEKLNHSTDKVYSYLQKAHQLSPRNEDIRGELVRVSNQQ